ncbi:MAG TPA: 8-oxo-dGTP diphosphatase MutT [Desulfobacterales bacterium]|nr:8-oxo-dGTP diphosphatase MutT [Desulfobacterales bacterium]
MKKRWGNKPHLEVTAALVWDGDRILIARRPPGTHMEGYWEFPGGKREPGETLEQCLKRELMEELGLEVEVLEPLVRVNYEYQDRIVELHVFHCKVLKGEAVAKESQEICWVSPKDLGKYSFPPPDKEIVKNIVLRAPTKNT